MQIKDITTIYLRTSPRLPKIIALAVLLNEYKKQNLPMPRVEMRRADEQKPSDGIYQLDCGDNEYRKRDMASELAVVMEDFGIKSDPVLGGLLFDLGVHNGRIKSGEKPFFMNGTWGSAGWFTVCAWMLIDSVPPSHWRWASALDENSEGQLVLDDHGIPQMHRLEKPEPLKAQDFLGMCVDLIQTFLFAQYNQEHNRSWGEGLKLKVIKSMLDANFTGANLQDRRLLCGSFAFPTLSGYIRDLWVTGNGVDEIRKRLRPWLRLWELAGHCYIDAASLKPTRYLNLGGFKGVMFDLTIEKSPAADGNPIIHQRWLAEQGEDSLGDDDPLNYGIVVMRRDTGHVAIFGRERYEKRLELLCGALNFLERGRWAQQGYALYNGSYSRVDQEPTKLPFAERKPFNIGALTEHAINRVDGFSRDGFDAGYYGATEGMFD